MRTAVVAQTPVLELEPAVVVVDRETAVETVHLAAPAVAQTEAGSSAACQRIVVVVAAVDS